MGRLIWKHCGKQSKRAETRNTPVGVMKVAPVRLIPRRALQLGSVTGENWRTGETKVKGRRGAGGRKEKGGTWL